MSEIVVEKSPGDLNEYQYFKLSNNLKVLLIQDNNTKQLGEVNQESNLAFCSVSVNAGSFNNPKKREGLAHFLEHMIFLGSEQYPSESELSTHIGSYGGVSNAYTEFEWTSFQFQVTYEGLEKTLDMLASALDRPKLDESCMNREITAIENEF